MTMTESATGTQGIITWRCPKCGRILAKLRLGHDSYVQIKCQCNNVAEKP